MVYSEENLNALQTAMPNEGSAQRVKEDRQMFTREANTDHSEAADHGLGPWPVVTPEAVAQGHSAGPWPGQWTCTMAKGLGSGPWP